MPLLPLPTGKLRYREAGKGAAPPLVFIHGAGASSAIWLGLLHRFARERRVVAVDLPGHGRSEGAPESVEEMRDAVGLACAHLCLPPSVLVGHSLGGPIALSAAAAWPDKVAGLILITTGARLRVSPSIFEALAPAAWPRWPELLAQVGYSPETPADTRRRGAGIACAASREQTEADFRAAQAFDGRAGLAAIRAPSLVITADHDLLTPPRWGEALAAALPDAQRVHIPASGHMPMHEQPDALAAAMRAWLAAVTGTSGANVPGSPGH